jgi:DnaJ-class molecular chaperone
MTDHELLGLAPDAGLDDLKERWHDLAHEHHPDKGGDPEKFMVLLAAYRRLQLSLQEPATCARCGGGGKELVKQGLVNMTLTCSGCGGDGTVVR